MEQQKRLLQTIQLKNLLEFYGEDVIAHGKNYYKLSRHDSLIIKNDVFYWNSRHIGGNAINLMKELYNKNDMEARQMIQTYLKEIGKNFISNTKEEKIEKKGTNIILKNDFEKVKDYLVNKRGIDLEIVKALYTKKIIQIDIHNNILFEIKDLEGKAKGYDVIGTTSKRYRANTSKSYGTNFLNSSEPQNLYIFEAPIDLISFLEINKKKEIKFEPARFLSLSGLREDILQTYLTKEIKKIVACVDNDVAGTNFYNHLKEKYKSFNIERKLPTNKDWNEDLIELKKNCDLIVQQSCEKTKNISKEKDDFER